MSKTEIQPFQSTTDAEWAARIMAGSEPWVTLGTGYERSLHFLSNASQERFLAKVAGEPAGFLMISMQGAFVGYIQLLGVARNFRGRGVGRALIEHAEQRIFRETPNVFICVSDFNQEAQRFYAKTGYQRVGELTDFIIAGHSEILLRKTIGPIRAKA
ncbi:MAG: GNAT family N-acetyltransferase [Betaproteobacteria bacterium]|nr:GNAT family N-acetyltransferase [Betaproteobacteria bacterium]